MYHEQSKKLFLKAQDLMPGGVNSPVRAFTHFGTQPPIMKQAKGAVLTDVDDNSYIDFCMSWGSLMLGHSHPKVVEEVTKQLANGTSFGTATKQEIEFAEMLISLHPCLEMLRMVSSGTEATMSALRLARGYTKRNKIVKFNGHYHGHSDGLLVKAGSGVLTSCVMASSSGVPEAVADQTICLPFLDHDLLRQVLYKQDVAAVIFEPVNANIGVVVPSQKDMDFLREITLETGTLLIMDEVVTGFRLGLGGAAKKFNIDPDLTCLGKIIGGGFPVALYGGKKKFMNLIAPMGGVYQAGTLSGNPVAIAAGRVTLNEISQTGFYDSLEEAMKPFDTIQEHIEKNALSASLQRCGSMWTLFFGKSQVRAFEDLKDLRYDLFKEYFYFLLESGVYISPAQYEASFISGTHTKEQIAKCVDLTIEFLEKPEITTSLRASTKEDLSLAK